MKLTDEEFKSFKNKLLNIDKIKQKGEVKNG
jgi:hypothetical protein